MSRIGKLPIKIPAGVNVTMTDGVVTVKGPKGELSQQVDSSIIVKIADGEIVFEVDEKSPVDYKQKQAYHGLYRALVNNMVVGVSEGYKKTLELVGVGYRVSNQGNVIEFSLGYTHPIFLELPKEVKVETKSERNQNPLLMLESCDKQLIGLICAKFVLSANRSLIRVRVSSSKARSSAENLVSQLLLSNLLKFTIMTTKKVERRIKIKYRIRKRVNGTAERPRLSVFRSNKQIYAQVINDLTGSTLASASSLGLEKMPKIQQAAKVGEMVAANAQAAGITTVVFDRNGYLYHGRVKELADAARKGGLKF